MDDRSVVTRQLGRPPRALRGVAARCPFGRPAVTVQEPYALPGEPFPPPSSLTSPHLVAAVCRSEAAGAVERWTQAADRDSALAELAAEYRGSESWVREAIAELPSPAQWQPGLTTATDAAFYLFARGAQDYEP